MKLPGWKYLGSAVYEHRSGGRAHMNGYCWPKGGRFISGNAWPESLRLCRWVRIAGGYRRGVLAWAAEKFQD